MKAMAGRVTLATRKVPKIYIDQIESGKIKSVSIGYYRDYIEDSTGSTYKGKPYNRIETDLYLNHLAILAEDAKGRCTYPECGIPPTKEGVLPADEYRTDPMHPSWRSMYDAMIKKYGAKKGKQVFYATLNERGWDDSKPRPKSKKKKKYDAYNDNAAIELKFMSEVEKFTDEEIEDLPDDAFLLERTRQLPIKNKDGVLHLPHVLAAENLLNVDSVNGVKGCDKKLCLNALTYMKKVLGMSENDAIVKWQNADLWQLVKDRESLRKIGAIETLAYKVITQFLTKLREKNSSVTYV